MIKHTPLPWAFFNIWKAGPNTVHYKSFGNLRETVITTTDPHADIAISQNNAAYLFNACNFHEELVDMLHKVINIVSPLQHISKADAIILKQARDLLAKVDKP